MGINLYTQRKYKKAEEIFKKALEIDNSDKKAWYNLALCYESQGKHFKAEIAYRNADK